MSVKIGTVRTELGRALRGLKDMRKLNLELRRQLAAAKNTLEQIAGSYPVTDEGETLASLARDALKELAK